MPSDVKKCSSVQDGPYLKLLIEPVNKIRFRYQSEKGSHGVLTGKDGKKTFPTVKLENYNGSKDVIIKASLYTEDKKSLHVLDLVGKNCKDGVCCQKLNEDNTVQFSTLSILNRKKEEVERVLFDRKLSNCSANEHERMKQEKKIEKEVKKEVKDINLKSASLCFEAFQDDIFRTPLCEKIFSERINDQKSTDLGDLKICRISKPSGSCHGGEDIILLCDKVKKEDIKVRFFEVDEDKVIWEDYGCFNKADVHYQVAIPFRTPPYRENVEKTVFIQLVRISNGDTSQAITFHYIPDENDLNDISRKRKKCNPHQEVSILSKVSQPLLSIAENENSSPLNDLSQDLDSIPLTESETFELSSFLLEELEKCSSNADLTSFNVSGPYDMDYRLFDELPDTSHSYTGYEAQAGSEPVATDGLCGEMEKLKINIPNIPQSIHNYSIVKNKQISKQCFESLLLKDLDLLQHYASSLVTFQDKKGNILPHSARKQQKLRLIQNFLKLSPCLVNQQNKSKETLLHLATHHNNPDVLSVLLDYGGNPNLKNENGNNCFHIAAKNNCVDCIKVLLSVSSTQDERVLHLNVLNHEGLAPLHIALMALNENSKEEFCICTTAESCICTTATEKCITLLLENGADVNIKEAKSGRTVLHLAVSFFPHLVPFFLKQPGISLSEADFSGNTALHIATNNDLHDVVRMLKANAESEQACLTPKMIDSLTEYNLENVTDENPSFIMPTNGSDTSSLQDGFHSFNLLPELRDEKHFLTPSVEKALCDLMDPPDERWHSLGLAMGFEESVLNNIAKLANQGSPTKTLLNYFQKKHKSYSTGTSLKELECLLEIVGIKDIVIP